jgi:hypothetical protein
MPGLPGKSGMQHLQHLSSNRSPPLALHCMMPGLIAKEKNK